MGGIGNNILYGGDGNDILSGNQSSYFFDGLKNAILYGGDGNDTYFIDSSYDTVIEAANSGIDTINSLGSYTLGSNQENLTLEDRRLPSDEQGTGNSLDNIIIGSSGNNILQGLAGNDTIIGGYGDDTFLVSSTSVGERDVWTGNKYGTDTFILGNATQVFYDDRNSATVGRGDYALITDFNSDQSDQDVIKLNGRRTDYRLALSPAGLPTGTAIYRNKPTGEPDELIAIVQGSSGLSLNSNYFRFTSGEFNLSALNGSNGFTINGINANDNSGSSVSAAGDVNGDGFDDLIIGAPRAEPNGQYGAGESYVVFGKAGGFTSSINLSALDGTNGFRINGIAGDRSGYSVSAAGDMNGDGLDDLMIGAPYASPNGQFFAGESYIIFGRDFTNSVTQTGTEGNDTLTGTASADILIGGLGNDRIIGGKGSDVLLGGAGNDIISFGVADRRSNGGSGTDTLRIDFSDNIDLTTLSNNKFTAFEIIDLTGTGNNSLTFTRLDVLDLSDTTNPLIVNGNVGDKVTSTSQGWTLGGTTTLNGIEYERYTSQAATLLVDTDITQTLT